MNKTLILLLVFTVQAWAWTDLVFEEKPQVEASQQAMSLNLITLFQVQTMMFWCLFGSFTSLFWADGGAYYRRCFSNFVAMPMFY